MLEPDLRSEREMVDRKLGSELCVVYLFEMVKRVCLVAISVSGGVEIVEVCECDQILIIIHYNVGSGGKEGARQARSL